MRLAPPIRSATAGLLSFDAGQRAERDGSFIPTLTKVEFSMRLKSIFSCGMLSLLSMALTTSIASAQTEVFGSGFVNYQKNGSPYWVTKFEHIAVNAWLDEDGVAHGTVAWTGDTNRIPVGEDVNGDGQALLVGGLADPFFVEVTEIFFFGGNGAYVVGNVVSCPNKEEIGGMAGFYFLDNEGVGAPDEINFHPTDAGNIRVR